MIRIWRMNTNSKLWWARVRWWQLPVMILALLSGLLWAVSANAQWEAILQSHSGGAVATKFAVDVLNQKSAYFNFWAAISSALTAFAAMVQKMFEEGVTWK